MEIFHWISCPWKWCSHFQVLLCCKFGYPTARVESSLLSNQPNFSWGVGLPVTLEASSWVWKGMVAVIYFLKHGPFHIKGGLVKSHDDMSVPLIFRYTQMEMCFSIGLKYDVISVYCIRYDFKLKNPCANWKGGGTMKLNIGWTLAWFDVSETETWWIYM